MMENDLRAFVDRLKPDEAFRLRMFLTHSGYDSDVSPEWALEDIIDRARDAVSSSITKELARLNRITKEVGLDLIDQLDLWWYLMDLILWDAGGAVGEAPRLGRRNDLER